MMKRSLMLAVAVAVLFAAWFFMPEKRKAIEMPRLVKMPSSPVAQPSAPLAASEPVAHARKKPSVAKKGLPSLKIGKLVMEGDKAVKATQSPDLFSNALVSKDKPNVNLDLGGKLPWPYPVSPWMPKNRDLGFHVGLDYRLNDNVDLSGIAGVTVPSDAYSLKPNVEQIGVRARFRF